MQKFVGSNVIHLDAVGSTNNYAAQRFREGSINSGTVVLADIQTEGKGQRGKKWDSDPYSNLMFSIVADLNLWKIKNIISLNHIVAVALRTFLIQYVPNTFIKWPNDIMLNDKKAVGILIENQLSSTQQRSVIGVGININQDCFDIPRATSLLLETGIQYKPQELILEIIDQFNFFIREYQNRGEEYFLQLFNSFLWKAKTDHIFEYESKKEIGQIQSTTIHGNLNVQFEDKEKSFANGEVSY